MKFPTRAGFFTWRPAAWLRVSGTDAANFLQGQFTNDLGKLTAGNASYGLWLNVKGKVVADGFVLRGTGADEFWVASYFSAASAIRERLESFIIADDVSVDDQTAGWAGVTLLGDGAKAIVGAMPGDEFLFPGRRERSENFEWMFPATKLAEVRARLGSRPEFPPEEMDRRRIVAGIAAVPADVGPGDLPNEAGLEADAISYTKGCYLGQEVMARLKSMGQVRRRLLRVAGAVADKKIPACPADLFLGDRKVGELRSAASDGADGFVGLAMLALMRLTPGASLAFFPGGDAAVRLVDSP